MEYRMHQKVRSKISPTWQGEVLGFDFTDGTIQVHWEKDSRTVTEWVHPEDMEPVGNPDCGTPKGARGHTKNGEGLCRACKDFKNAEARRRRRDNPPDRDLENAKVSAMRRLAQAHPEEFERLIIEEVAVRLQKKGA